VNNITPHTQDSSSHSISPEKGDDVYHAYPILLRCFLWSVCIILLLTASAKLFTGLADTAQLRSPDPVLSFMQSRDILSLTIFLEYSISAFLIFSRNTKIKLLVVFVLSLLFVWYRFGLYMFDYTTSCRCLGTLAKAYIADTPLKYILSGILLYMFLGSACALYAIHNPTVAAQPRSNPGRVLLSAIALGSLTCNAAEPFAEPFHIEGELRCTFFRDDKSIITNQSFQFSVKVVGRNRWLLRNYETADK
jgi:hypothetical protein